MAWKHPRPPTLPHPRKRCRQPVQCSFAYPTHQRMGWQPDTGTPSAGCFCSPSPAPPEGPPYPHPYPSVSCEETSDGRCYCSVRGVIKAADARPCYGRTCPTQNSSESCCDQSQPLRHPQSLEADRSLERASGSSGAAPCFAPAPTGGTLLRPHSARALRQAAQDRRQKRREQNGKQAGSRHARSAPRSCAERQEPVVDCVDERPAAVAARGAQEPVAVIASEAATRPVSSGSSTGCGARHGFKKLNPRQMR